MDTQPPTTPETSKSSLSGPAEGTPSDAAMSGKASQHPVDHQRHLDIIADKQLRLDLDEHLQQLKALSPSRERALCITKLQECIMWLGMDLKRLGGPNPYPTSYDPKSTVVDLPKDVKL